MFQTFYVEYPLSSHVNTRDKPFKYGLHTYPLAKSLLIKKKTRYKYKQLWTFRHVSPLINYAPSPLSEYRSLSTEYPLSKLNCNYMSVTEANRAWH